MSITLTMTQLRQIRDNGYDIREAVDQLQSIPEWADLTDIAHIQSVIETGTEGFAHSSCFPHIAKEVFFEYELEIIDYLSESCLTFTFDLSEGTFSSFISTMLQTAVEMKAHEFLSMLDGVN